MLLEEIMQETLHMREHASKIMCFRALYGLANLNLQRQLHLIFKAAARGRTYFILRPNTEVWLVLSQTCLALTINSYKCKQFGNTMLMLLDS